LLRQALGCFEYRVRERDGYFHAKTVSPWYDRSNPSCATRAAPASRAAIVRSAGH
jgi:hypothetical protein